MAIIHIDGARAIFLLLRDHQDTKPELCEIDIRISQPIFTHKKYKIRYGKTIYIIYNTEENIVAILHIYGDRSIFYYSVITKTLNLSNKKWKLV